MYLFLSANCSSDDQGLDRYVTIFTGVWRASWAVTFSKMVLNHVLSDRDVGREGAWLMVVACREASRAGQSVEAQLGGGGGAEKGGFEAKEDGYVVGTSQGEGISPVREVGCQEGARKASSSRPGGPTSDMEKRVMTPGVLPSEKLNSVALSEYGAEVGISSSLNTRRGSAVG